MYLFLSFYNLCVCYCAYGLLYKVWLGGKMAANNLALLDANGITSSISMAPGCQSNARWNPNLKNKHSFMDPLEINRIQKAVQDSWPKFQFRLIS